MRHLAKIGLILSICSATAAQDIRIEFDAGEATVIGPDGKMKSTPCAIACAGGQSFSLTVKSETIRWRACDGDQKLRFSTSDGVWKVTLGEKQLVAALTKNTLAHLARFKRGDFAWFVWLDIRQHDERALRLVSEKIQGFAGVSLALPTDMELKAITSNPRLKMLKIHSCRELSTLGPIGNARGLEYLFLMDERTLSDLEILANHTELQVLRVEHVRRLNSLKGLVEMDSLEELVLHDCKRLEDLSHIRHSNRLKRLGLILCPVKSLEPLRDVPKLESLTLIFVPLENHSILPSLAGLKHLTVEGVKSISRATDLQEVQTRLPSCRIVFDGKTLEQPSGAKTE